MSRLAQLLRYISKVYHLPQLLKGVRDTRDPARVRIPTSAIALAWILTFCARLRSREEAGRCLDRPAVQRIIECHISSDTLGRVLGQLSADSIRTELLVPVVRQMRRNKAWQNGTVSSQVLAGIDGSEAFCSRRQHCPQCLSRQIEVHGETVTEYYHRAVWAFIIGMRPGVFLDVELVRPGEGEVQAATRLVSRIAEHYGRWVDGIVADALYAGAPFLNHVRDLGLHYIVRVKQEDRYLVQDAQRFCSQHPPDAQWQERIGHHRLKAVAWDMKGSRWSWRALKEPARVVACDETELAEAPSRRRQFAQPERHRPRDFFLTSYPKQILPTRDICFAYHRRWDIENAGMRQLKQEWHWDHPFVHTPGALEALWLLLAVAANLFVSFVGRRLLATRSGVTAWRAVAQEIAADILYLTVTTARNWNTS